MLGTHLPNDGVYQRVKKRSRTITNLHLATAFLREWLFVVSTPRA